MSRLLLLLVLLFAIRGHAEVKKEHCDWTGIEIDKYGCVNYSWYKLADSLNCSNMPKCFKFGMKEIGKKENKKEEMLELPEPEYFKSEPAEEKAKVMPILDSSAVALLKNSKLKDIKIIFYNKTGKLSKDFQKEAEKYLLDKGVKREQFNIEIR